MPFKSSLTRLFATGAFICGTISMAFSQGKSSLLIDSNAKAQVFAPGVVSTPYTEWATSFAPDGKTVYFSQGALFWTIVYSKLGDKGWMKPSVAAFSGRWRDTDPFVSPDGKKMFFISNRPLEGAPQDKARTIFSIWYVDHISGEEWSAPHLVGSPVNLDSVSNYAPSVDQKGSLYFCSRDREGHSGMASYCSSWTSNGYEKPKLLALNGTEDTQDPFTAPDGKYLVFVSGNDLYISYANANGGWSRGEKLAKQVNNGDANSSPYVSRDGKILYYSSSRIQGFYKRDVLNHALNYDELIAEMQSLFNTAPNILMIPVNLPLI